ncbi:MAG: MerR family transcriptional regulator, partial [Lactobacillus sp.]|nr:MerR family transcriptional regulator [Lactobacillus sp.]
MLSIGKMAKYCHTTIQTLRFYDQKGLLKPIYINPDNNYRYYKDDQIFHFMIIQYLQETGMTLEEIKKIMQTETTNLYSFWQKQEKRLKEIIAKEKQVLELAKFQQKQSLELNLLKNKLNKG